MASVLKNLKKYLLMPMILLKIKKLTISVILHIILNNMCIKLLF